MNTIKFEAQARTDMGKKATKALRKQGLIPCVMYGGKDNMHFGATQKQIKDIVFTDKFVIAKVTVDGDTREAILKDVDFHPVTDEVLHIDFQELVKGKKVKIEIPIKLEGLAKGVKNGGVLSQNLRTLSIKARPEEFVTDIEVDITKLGIGKSIKVKELDLSFDVLTPGSIPVVQVIVPRTLRSAGLTDEDDESEEGAEGGDAAESTEAAAE